MFTVVTYLVSLIVILISVFITLYIKSELVQLFRDKKAVGIFHICNVVIILMVSLQANTVMTIYIFEKEFRLMLQLSILKFTILPIYILGHLSFEKYKVMNRKYTTAENGKVIILKEKHLRKKQPSKFKH